MKKVGLLLMVFILAASAIAVQPNETGHPEAVLFSEGHSNLTGGSDTETNESGPSLGVVGNASGNPNLGVVSNASDNPSGEAIQPILAVQEQNKGQDSQVMQEIKARTGDYTAENGKQIRIEEQVNNRVKLESSGVTAESSLEMLQEQSQNKTKLQVMLSNGNKADVKIMPDTASEKAIERLQMKVCTDCKIELKEVSDGEQVRAAYEVQAQKEAKILGLFKTKMHVEAQVDAETGQVIETKKPWWAFLASE